MFEFAHWVLQKSDPLLSACVMVLSYAVFRLSKSIQKQEGVMQAHLAEAQPHVSCGFEKERHQEMVDKIEHLDEMMTAKLTSIEEYLRNGKK